MRWLVLLAIGCHHSHGGIGNAESGHEQTLAATGTCTARLEGWKPGNQDRYSFEDKKAHKFGYKDKRGKVVIAAQFIAVYEFAPTGIAAVVVGGKQPFAFIDTTGKVVAPAYAFDNGPDYFQEGYARIVDAQGRIGYMSEHGDVAIAPQFEAAASFCHGKAEVADGGETFYIDTRGTKTAAPPRDKPEHDD